MYRSKEREAPHPSTPTKPRPQKRAAEALDTSSEPRAAAAELVTPPGPPHASKKTKSSAIVRCRAIDYVLGRRQTLTDNRSGYNADRVDESLPVGSSRESGQSLNVLFRAGRVSNIGGCIFGPLYPGNLVATDLTAG